MTDLTPREIVSELDRFIIGQKDAKRAVAVALRNRWRRKQLADDIRDEVYPKNILMIGPTGVGKTEISRRLAKLAKAPFLKMQHSEAEIDAMRSVKDALDPKGILNPGKILEPFEVWEHAPVDVKLPWDHADV